MKRFLLAALFMMGLSSSVFGMGNMPSSAVLGALIGKAAPEFTLENTAGATQSLTQARAGQKAILFFWATWCPHCHEELERVRQNLDQIKSQGIQIILIDVGEDKNDAKAFLKRQQLSLESFVDEDNVVAGQYSVVGIPTLVFIDDKGILTAITHDFPNDYQRKFSLP